MFRIGSISDREGLFLHLDLKNDGRILPDRFCNRLTIRFAGESGDKGRAGIISCIADKSDDLLSVFHCPFQMILMIHSLNDGHSGALTAFRHEGHLTGCFGADRSLAPGDESNIFSVSDIDTEGTYGNATYLISDQRDGSTGTFQIYRGYGLNGQKFNAKGATIIKEGDEVVVYGKVVNYKGNTPQFAQGSTIVSIK